MERWGRYNQFNDDEARKRFLSRVIISENGCHVWVGARNGSKRYGCAGFRGKPELAHRVAWMLWQGAIPAGLCVCHKCDNGFCVNTDHLFLGTQKDNILDMEAKGRSLHPCREAHGRAKLTWADVLAIRAAHANGQSMNSLGRQYNVSSKNIGAIIRREIWKDHHTMPACP